MVVVRVLGRNRWDRLVDRLLESHLKTKLDLPELKGDKEEK